MNTMDYTVCNKGDTLTPDAARILVRTEACHTHVVTRLHSPPVSQKLFEKPMATFRLTLVSSWNAADGAYEGLAVANVGAAAGSGAVELDLKFD